MGGIFRPTQQVNEGRIYMLAAMLQAIFKFVLRFGLIFGLVFMVACTVFVIVCIFRGDIRISIIKDCTEKEDKSKGTCRSIQWMHFFRIY